MSARIDARLFKGTRDLLPAEMLPRQRMLAVLTRVFETFGFAPVETPAMEHLDILLGKYGEEGEKLIYPLAYKGGRTLALRYDLTVPLSRLVAMNPELQKPFKRYQIQPVWRADRAQPEKGRWREFYQCDVDTVGSASLLADAENLACCWAVFAELGLGDPALGLSLRVNDRRLLRALVVDAGLPADQDKVVCTALDKIDKIGRDEVEKELQEKGIDASRRAALFERIDAGQPARAGMARETLAAVAARLEASEEARLATARLGELFDHAEAMGVPRQNLCFDLVLTRGLDYYTGPIYEFALGSLEGFGSLGGGGRYDDLMSMYGLGEVPATGVSIGLSRMQAALEKLGRLEKSQTPTRVLVTRLGDQTVSQQLQVVRHLRQAGIAAEIWYEADRLKKQIQYADRLGIPYVVIQGPDEAAQGKVQLKTLATGEQSLLDLDALVQHPGLRPAPQSR